MSNETLTFLSACAKIALYDYDKMGWADIVQFSGDIEDTLNVLLRIDAEKVDPLFEEDVLDIKSKILSGFGGSFNNDREPAGMHYH